MSTTTYNNGGFSDQIIRNLCVSAIADKHKLFVDYSNYDKIKLLGIYLHGGPLKYEKTEIVNDDNFFDVLNSDSIDYNINADDSFFQTKEISNYLYTYLQKRENKRLILPFNEFNKRHGNNNDCFVHVSDGTSNLVFEYYDKVLSEISFDNLYISCVNSNDDVVQQIMNKYQNSSVLSYEESDTIKFASTNKYVILSSGSLSAVIGYVSYDSTVYYPDYENTGNGGLLSIPTWNKIEY
jgi:hypothetical protein